MTWGEVGSLSLWDSLSGVRLCGGLLHDSMQELPMGAFLRADAVRAEVPVHGLADVHAGSPGTGSRWWCSPDRGARPCRASGGSTGCSLRCGGCCRTPCRLVRYRAGCWGGSTSLPTAEIFRRRPRARVEACRLRPLRHLRQPVAEMDRAADAELVAMFAACRSARDRLVVLLLNGTGPAFCPCPGGTGKGPPARLNTHRHRVRYKPDEGRIRGTTACPPSMVSNARTTTGCWQAAAPLLQSCRGRSHIADTRCDV
ncbi:hypothetical protein SAMN05216252_13465 [Actinacidiphila glaucinigra]|uniref:Uncharacterized protein n=1 Tax=Actinacidiphila glaucinigra TaxID=235986 RepID=A0A239NEK8_9ACTN|nr:hypothetical protein SAMN05216252_13465 [Actinacidiphila glaucinigra]